MQGPKPRMDGRSNDYNRSRNRCSPTSEGRSSVEAPTSIRGGGLDGAAPAPPPPAAAAPVAACAARSSTACMTSCSSAAQGGRQKLHVLGCWHRLACRRRTPVASNGRCSPVQPLPRMPSSRQRACWGDASKHKQDDGAAVRGLGPSLQRARGAGSAWRAPPAAARHEQPLAHGLRALPAQAWRGRALCPARSCKRRPTCRPNRPSPVRSRPDSEVAPARRSGSGRSVRTCSAGRSQTRAGQAMEATG